MKCLFFMAVALSLCAGCNKNADVFAAWLSCEGLSCRSELFYYPDSVEDMRAERLAIEEQLRIIGKYLGDFSGCRSLPEKPMSAYYTISLSAGGVSDLAEMPDEVRKQLCQASGFGELLFVLELKEVGDVDKIKTLVIGLPASDPRSKHLQLRLVEELRSNL